MKKIISALFGFLIIFGFSPTEIQAQNMFACECESPPGVPCTGYLPDASELNECIDPAAATADACNILNNCDSDEAFCCDGLVSNCFAYCDEDPPEEPVDETPVDETPTEEEPTEIATNEFECKCANPAGSSDCQEHVPDLYYPPDCSEGNEASIYACNISPGCDVIPGPNSCPATCLPIVEMVQVAYGEVCNERTAVCLEDPSSIGVLILCRESSTGEYKCLKGEGQVGEYDYCADSSECQLYASGEVCATDVDGRRGCFLSDPNCSVDDTGAIICGCHGEVVQEEPDLFKFYARDCDYNSNEYFYEYTVNIYGPNGFLFSSNNVLIYKGIGSSDWESSSFRTYTPGTYTAKFVQKKTAAGGADSDFNQPAYWKFSVIEFTAAEPEEDDEPPATGDENTDIRLCVTDDGDDGFNTALGCIALTSPVSLVSQLVGIGIGLGSGIALILLAYAAFTISTSQGDPHRLMHGKELLFSALAGLLLIIFATFILRLLGFSVLGLF